MSSKIILHVRGLDEKELQTATNIIVKILRRECRSIEDLYNKLEEIPYIDKADYELDK